MKTIGRYGVIAFALVELAGTTSYAPSDATRERSTVIAIPPSGTIELASFGPVELTVEGGQIIEAMHLRMVIANGGDIAPWTVDLPDTALVIGTRRIAAIAINSDLATLPAVVVDTGEVRTLDLYFPLSADTPAFELAWRVTTPTREIHERTPFARDAAVAPAMTGGRGSHWWFAPGYPWATYRHHDGWLTPRTPTWAEVRRPHDADVPFDDCAQW
jgi:hypothetical protein